jgi:hypothetical protein
MGFADAASSTMEPNHRLGESLERAHECKGFKDFALGFARAPALRQRSCTTLRIGRNRAEGQTRLHRSVRYPSHWLGGCPAFGDGHPSGGTVFAARASGASKRPKRRPNQREPRRFDEPGSDVGIEETAKALTDGGGIRYHAERYAAVGSDQHSRRATDGATDGARDRSGTNKRQHVGDQRAGI